jgi:lysophospholipid acyltransferase (LPLAT)-like uncharacterized protein
VTDTSEEPIRHAWAARLTGRAMALYVRLVARTSRVSGSVTRDQVVLAFWHEYNLVASVAARVRRNDLRHVSFSTQTYRGLVMDTMLAALGAGSVPLPRPDRRGEAARLALELARLGREGSTVAVSPDGPLGPYRRAKPGALLVARESGLALQAWGLSARPSVRLGGRWDRHVVPLPFSRIRVFEAEPFVVPEREELRPLLKRLQGALDEVAAAADGAAGSG